MASQPEEAEAGPSGLQMSSDDDEAYNELMDHLERQASQPEDDGAGPSGLARHDQLALLGPEHETTSCHGPLLFHEEMPDSDDDLCHEAMDHLERQHAFQTHLLQQSGGGLDTSAIGVFEFDIDGFVDRRSTRMGVRERHFNTQLRQRGNLIPGQNITQALQDALRRAVNQVLATTPDLHDQDRLYFTIASNRLHNNFQGWGLRAGEWRQDRACGGSVPPFSPSPQQQRTI